MALKKITGNGVAKSDMDIKKALSLSHKKGDGFRYIAELEAENERLKKALRDIAEGKHEHMLTSNPPKNAATEFAKRFLEGEQE